MFLHLRFFLEPLQIDLAVGQDFRQHTSEYNAVFTRCWPVDLFVKHRSLDSLLDQELHQNDQIFARDSSSAIVVVMSASNLRNDTKSCLDSVISRAVQCAGWCWPKNLS
ncbi:MAG: hypothetical protein CME86_20085 [Herbaspirillum sp.]|nr:hypothetical protein [Herbaspirillum sp.]